jgi:hypothetical protein
MQKARGRFVNFRVTDEEFKQLKIACDQCGARGLSAFARKAILEAPNLDGEHLCYKVAALDRRLAILEVSISQWISTLAGPSVEVHVSEK